MVARQIRVRRGVGRCFILIGALIAGGCLRAAPVAPASPGPAGSAAEQALPVPSDLQEGVDRASALGANLFFLDVATALAWDALAARGGPPSGMGIGHYLALIGGNEQGDPDGSVQVLFFTDEHVPRLAYRVRVKPAGETASEVLALDPPGIVHEPLMTLLNARLLALEAIPPTTQALNPVLLPQRSGQIVVYLLAATQQPNVAVLGRHYRVEVSSDGTAVESVTALSGAEREVPTRDSSGQKVVALAVTDGAAEHPSETHVFASRMANVPIYVTTGRGRWKVRASGIDYLGTP